MGISEDMCTWLFIQTTILEFGFGVEFIEMMLTRPKNSEVSIKSGEKMVLTCKLVLFLDVASDFSR